MIYKGSGKQVQEKVLLFYGVIWEEAKIHARRAKGRKSPLSLMLDSKLETLGEERRRKENKPENPEMAMTGGR